VDSNLVQTNTKLAHGQTSKDVQHWRSQLLRLLDPLDATARTENGKKLKVITRAARRQAALDSGESFWGRCKCFLDRQNSDKTQEGLAEIMYSAVDLSFRLWTQRSYMTHEGHDLLTQPYSRKNKVLAASGLHTAELEEDEKCMDGQPILLVFHPAVILYGDSEGTDYSTRRILKKAVVWMG
jgi:hypothetical protein